MDIGVELHRESKIAFHYCHPADFKPLPSKINILMTMYESTPVPDEFQQAFRRADAVFVPSRFVFNLFKPLIGKTPMRISKLGVDVEMFTFAKRSWNRNDAPFHWLFCGAPNGRKGLGEIIACWGRYFQDDQGVDLTIKTSMESEEGKIILKKNVVFDSRTYSSDQLRDLYHQANGFIFPTQGEGFGLTLAEAAATGLPIVTTRYGGQTDFLDQRIAWFCDHKLKRVHTIGDKPIPYDAACADIASMAKEMRTIMADYPAALRKAAHGALRINKTFTWRKAAFQFVKNIESLGFAS